MRLRDVTPFLYLDNRQPQYAQGYRSATKSCVNWLERRAEEIDTRNTSAAAKKARMVRQLAAQMAREAKAIAFADEDTPEPRHDP